MHDLLAGKTALITGSVQGIGLAIARCFATAGMRLAIHGLATPEKGHAVASELVDLGAAEACFFDANLRDPPAIDRMMRDLEHWGPLDILVNNAGIQKTALLSEIEPDVWDAVLAVNLTAPFHTMRRALPGMAERGYGRIINIASVHGLVASKAKAPYVAAKFGLVGLSRVAALEYAASGSRASGGVTVNCICPGWTETELIDPQIRDRQLQHSIGRDEAIVNLLAEKQPSLRMTEPAEIGDLALWLCQPVAHNVTGIAIPVDGGWTAQ